MPKRILLVDDEWILMEVVSRRLRSVGYEVTSAFDGEEALAQVPQIKPDLIILDLMLPKIDGYQVCQQLKSQEEYKAIPILICSARTQQQDIKRVQECGANDYLKKPFQSEELLEKIRQLLKEA